MDHFSRAWPSVTSEVGKSAPKSTAKQFGRQAGFSVLRLSEGRGSGFPGSLFSLVIFHHMGKMAHGWISPGTPQGRGSLALGLLITMHALAQELGPPPSDLQQSTQRPWFF